MYEKPTPQTECQPAEKDSDKGIVFKHDKDGLAIYITIYNTNNNANEGSEAGLKQHAENGGQIAGPKGQNANQGGQIAGTYGKNANQDSEVCCEAVDDELGTASDDISLISGKAIEMPL